MLDMGAEFDKQQVMSGLKSYYAKAASVLVGPNEAGKTVLLRANGLATCRGPNTVVAPVHSTSHRGISGA
jgi:ABC-type branched-subunit amino acid transport system ATPase component